jgi:O-antigen ligase
MATAVLILRPALGPPVLVMASLFAPLEVRTGTEVSLNLATLLVPALSLLWLVTALRRRSVALTPCPANRPLLLFLAAAILSLLIGNALWPPSVPRSSHFLLVQLAQWGLFACSAGAFLLAANALRDEQQLRRLTFFFLAVSGAVVLIFRMPVLSEAIEPAITIAFIRVPFWLLVTAIAAGQLLFNEKLLLRWRLFLVAVLIGVLVYSFGVQQQTVSNWLAIVITLAVLAWFRWPRLRWLAAFLVVAATATNFLFPAVYELAGGAQEWQQSGGSRLVLTSRVLELTLANNPVTGLGPASYRAYGYVRPLVYNNIVWLRPLISSHNNYVDLFAQTGVVGLALFIWFALEIARLGRRLRRRFTQGFAAGYVNSLMAAGAAALAIMLLADWVLPFVYNIGFPGFQASVLLWLFMGGLVALEKSAANADGSLRPPESGGAFVKGAG